MAFVYSTMSAGVNYTFAKSGELGGASRPPIFIAGGANVADKHFITPQGVVTEISDDDAAMLEAHPVFRIHFAHGHIKIQKSETRSMGKAVSDLATRDKSAPLTPDDYINQGKEAPKTGKAR